MTNEKESKVDENGVEYYAPDLNAPKPLNIPDRTEEDIDNFETKLDEKVIFQRVAKDLYKYPTSAVRELLVNAIGHGAKKANVLYGEKNKAYVEVKIHPHDRSLTITDVRGMGMTYAHIKSLMSFVGRSGNMDSSTAGQFGMGYFSHLKIADSCIVTTKVREPYLYKDKMITGLQFLNNKGWQWQKINIGDEDIDLEYPGTRISLTMNEDANIRDVIRTVKEVAKYSDVMIQLILEDDFDKVPAGVVDLEQIGDLTTIHKKTPEQEVIELDDDDVYFKAVIEKDRYGNMSHDQAKVFLLARVPILVDDKSMIPSFSGYVLNIKNERKFMPQPDRERLSVKSEIALKTKLEDLFKTHFSQLKGTTAEEIEAMPLKYPVLFMRQLNLEKYFTKATKDFILSLVDHNVKHIVFDELKITTEYSAEHNLLQILAYRKDAIMVYNKSLAPILAVHKYCVEQKIQPKQFLRIDESHTSKTAIALLEKWNIPKIKDYMIANKIKAKSNSKHITGLTLHKNENRRETLKITNFEDIDFTRTIWIKGSLKPWIKLLSRNHSDFMIAKYMKNVGTYAEENDISIITEATLYGMKDIDVITSKGKAKFSAWFNEAKSLLKFGYSNNCINLYKATPEELLQMDKILITLGYLDGKIDHNKMKSVNNAMIILNDNECVTIHDVSGNEIKVPFYKNFLFLTEAYELIQNGGSEVTDTINEQINIGKITLPDKKIKNFTELYSTSLFYTLPLNGLNEYLHSTANALSNMEYWKVQTLDIKGYFGINNSYKSKYDWKDDLATLQIVMDLLRENTKDENIQQMVFHGIHASSHDNFCSGINVTSYISTGRNESQLQVVKEKALPLIVGILKQIPSINPADKFDVFIKTRHALNNINLITKGGKADWLKTLKINDVIQVLESIKLIIGNVNSRISIKGKFAQFVNEFLKGSQSEIVETNNTISVKCNPTFALQVKNMVELHSDTELVQIKPDGQKLLLVFRTNDDPVRNTDRDGTDYTENINKCQCGCNNMSTLKLSKITTKIDDDDNDG